MSERRENIIKISISAALFIVALIVTNVIFKDIPYWGQLLIFLPSYLVSGYEVLLEAVEKLFKGRLLAEDFLMSVATIGALIIGDFRKGFLPLAQISCADQQALFEGIFQIPGDLNVRQNRREEYHHENQQNVAHGRLRADAFEIPFEINRLTHPSSSISKR